ncbi:thioredoxin family protein [Polaribacter sp. Q13]|uniref:thioredoxin family protein n=1 Tax=Polaribacter sp. Q13 TaxID=2806551 RepID=UPI00193B69C8|nr:thioredoxin family protein [Polaribacter sp. Q13]QVY65013.1 DUF255 domain-containing protein [Polaribacter sp. Q13]
MKNITTIIAALIISCTTFAQGIEFEHGTFQEALDKAKKENKLVFMDCYTTWCGPCKWMTKEIFPLKEVGDFYNENFVSIKVDMEKGEGIALNNTYSVNAYPTLLFIAPDGKLVHKLVGGKQAKDLIAGGEIAIDPNKGINVIAKRYENGERDLDLVLNYIDLLDGAYNKEKSQEVSSGLLASLPIDKFANKDRFKVIANAKIDYDSKAYKYVLKNKESFLKEVDSAQYFNVLNLSIMSYLNNKSGTSNSLKELQKAIDKCKKDNVSPYQEDMEKGLVYSFYLSQKNYDKWFDLKLEEANKQKGEQRYVYTIHNIGDEVLRNPKFEGSQESMDKALKLGHEIADTQDGIIMGSFLLAKLYLKNKDKGNASKYFNTFFEVNKKSGGNNDHPSVINVKNAIDAL